MKRLMWNPREGFGHGEEDCTNLERSIYGLVQSARQYFLKFTYMRSHISRVHEIIGRVLSSLEFKK